MKFSSLLITIIFFFALSNIALASIDVQTYTPSKDFLLTSVSDKLDICSCSYKIDSITVQNIGTWPAIYTVSTNEMKSKLTLSQNSFELMPGESLEVFLYITADCSRGTEDLKITVTSNLGPQKTLVKTITKDRCQNIEAWVSNYTKDIEPCQEKVLDINVHNIGPFSENYAVSSNHDQYITYNTKSFSLDSNQYAKVTATAQFPCEMYGQKDLKFTVTAQKNTLSATVDAELNILRDYDYEFKVGGVEGNAALSVCNRVYSKLVPVTIKNTGSVVNTYDISFSRLPKNLDIKDLSDKEFTLNPNETKTFYLDISSVHYRYQHRHKELTITVYPKLGDIEKKTVLDLEYLACYEHKVVIYDGDVSRKKPLQTCANYDYSYDVEIINDGSFVETYKLTLEGAPEGSELSDDLIRIKPGRDTVKLFIVGPETNQYYNIKVTATIANGISESDNTWIKSFDTQSCHATQIDADKFQINYQTPDVKVPITNKGLVDNAYIVSWEGSSIISNNDQILNLPRKATEDFTLSLDTEGLAEGTYNGTLILQDASHAKYTKDLQFELKDKSWFRKAFEFLAFTSKCTQVSLAFLFVILLIILLIIVFLVKGPHYQYNFRNRMRLKMPVLLFLIVVFLIGVAFVVSIAGLPKTNAQLYNLTQNDSELTYEWLQDHKFKLDASKFFFDPENMTLRYEVIGLEHIAAIAKGNIITFYPDKGWSGTEHANIVAFDKTGANVTSPAFTFTVIEVPQRTRIEFYSWYCWYVNLAVFAIILALIFVAVFVKQQRRTRK